MMFALDFVLGLILGAAITALAAMALFSFGNISGKPLRKLKS